MSHVGHDQRLLLKNSLFRECLRVGPPNSWMIPVAGVEHWRDSVFIVQRLSEISVSWHTERPGWAACVDVSPRTWIRVAQLVWSHSNNMTIFLMKLQSPMWRPARYIRVDDRKSARSQNPRSRVVLERMEKYVIDCLEGEILRIVSDYGSMLEVITNLDQAHCNCFQHQYSRQFQHEHGVDSVRDLWKR